MNTTVTISISADPYQTVAQVLAELSKRIDSETDLDVEARDEACEREIPAFIALHPQ